MKESVELVTENALNVMKNEYINLNRISRDFYVDTETAKHLFDKFCTGDKLGGYIQEINQNPFGMLMVSEIQVMT